jgi:hypothetical protein
VKHAKSGLFLGAASSVALLLGAAAPSVANADVHWLVSGLFDDGGSLSGFFDIDVYGYMTDYDLKTTAGSVVTTGLEYTPANSYLNNSIDTPFYIEAWNQNPFAYYGGIQLQFLDALITPNANNPIDGGSPGPSWECTASWVCPDQGQGATRYIASGSASARVSIVPEPAGWALLLTGFGGLGAALRLGRRKAPITAA